MLRAAILALCAALLLRPSPSAAAADPALELLQRSAAVYRSAPQLEIEGDVRADIRTGEREQTTVATFHVALGTEGRILDELRHPQAGLVRVRNGQRLWVYREGLGQYVEQAADDVDYTRPQSSGGVLGALMAALRHMDESVESAHEVAEEQVSFGGQERPCAVIEVRYQPGNAAQTNPDAPRTFWIDRQSKLVLQHRTVARATGGNTPVEQTETFHYARIVLDRAPSDTLFTFRVPAGAQRVERFQTGREPLDLSGQVAADFTLPDLDGQQHHLAALRGKKIVMLDFWASWCGPCRRQMPLVEKLGEEFKDRDLVVYAVNQGEAQQIARSYIDKYHYTTTTLLDQKGEVGRQYKVSGIPTLVIIDRDGKIAAHFVGVHTEDQLREGLKKAGL